MLDFCDGVWRACTTIKRLTNWMPGQTEIGNVLGFLDLVFGGPSHGIGLGEIDAFITVKALER